MSVFLQQPCNYSIDDSPIETEIRMIFFHHWSFMRDQLLNSFNAIDQWRLSMIEQITKHAEQQTRILGDYYDSLRVPFDQKQLESLQRARLLLNAQNMKELDELRDACRRLQIQVAQIQYPIASHYTVQVIPVQTQVDERTFQNNQVEQKPIIPPNPQTQDNITQNPSSNIDDNPESIPKCPVCCMIFPKKMTEQERNQHTNEHYTD